MLDTSMIACQMGEVEGFPSKRRMLPMEMLERVCMLLRPKDLKTVMLVCKKWNVAGSVPKLWSLVVFNDLGFGMKRKQYMYWHEWPKSQKVATGCMVYHHHYTYRSRCKVSPGPFMYPSVTLLSHQDLIVCSDCAECVQSVR